MRVEVAGLSRRFGGVTALDDVSFALPPGRRVALVGPNGSGKSTLNRVLVGLLAYEGSVLLDGASPRERSSEFARRVAYLPQVAPQLGAPVSELVRAVTTLRGVSPDAVGVRAAALGLDLARLRAAIRAPKRKAKTHDKKEVQEQLEQLIPGARLVGTRGFGRAVIRHMSD